MKAFFHTDEHRRSRLAQLENFLTDMDIPDNRRGVNTEASLEWLGRNMFVRNKNHRNFFEAAVALDALGVAVTGTRLTGKRL